MSEFWVGIRTVRKKGIPPLEEWTIPAPGFRVTCLDPNKSAASVSFRTNDGQAAVFLYRLGGQEFYALAYRNPYHLDCYFVYGADTDLNRAIEEASRKWNQEAQESIRDLEMSEEEFYHEFCVACQTEKEFECIYCENPWDRLSMVKDEVLKMLQAQAQKK